MSNSRSKRLASRSLLAALMAGTLASCDLMHDDQPPCAVDPTVSTVINFKYDYNMQYTDLFHQQAGSVYLYVFDNNGVFRLRREVHTADGSDLRVTFTQSELPAGTYQMVAIAEENPVGSSADGSMPTFQLVNDMVPGVSRIDDYLIRMDRDGDTYADFGVVNYKDTYGAERQMINTVWSTKPDEVQTVTVPAAPKIAPDTPASEQPDDIVVNVTIPMMRITNSVKINMLGEYITDKTTADDYMMLIYFPDGNGTIDFTGTTYPFQPLYYRSLWKEINHNYKVQSKSSRDDNSRTAIQATFGLSRLQAGDASELQIRDPETGEIIDRVENFSDFLAKYFEQFDNPQEFLDREYEFEVELSINEEGKIQWISVGVSVLGWAKRVYFVEL